MEPSRADPNSFAAKPSLYPADPRLNLGLDSRDKGNFYYIMDHKLWNIFMEWLYTVKT